MSIVIAIKNNNKIVMGCDRQVTKAWHLKQSTSKENAKIWDVKNLKGAIMCGVGCARTCQLVSLMDFVLSPIHIVSKQINYNVVAGEMFKNIYQHLVDNRCIGRDGREQLVNYIDGSFIFAYKNQAYEICANGYTIPIEDYLVIGSGAEVAIGVLEQTKDISPEERIAKAISACANKTVYVNNEIEIKKTR